jgi:hypothetical protein
MGQFINAEKLPAYGCLIEDGYKNTMMKKQGYLGEVYEKKVRDTIQAKYQIRGNQNMEDFTQWWLAYLNYGSQPFEIETVFLGYKGRLVVKMVNDLQGNYMGGGNWDVPLSLKVLHVIDDTQMS